MLFATISQWFKKYWLEGLILLVFGVIFSCVSFVNHYNFRTSALDLGMFNHALYSFAHGKMNYFTLDLHAEYPSYFADHFSPLTVLYAPLYYIFGSWTLLVVQILSILFGAVGCYKVCELKLPHSNLKYLVLVIFLAQWSIISALAFDFHNNVAAAMFVPWMYYYYLLNKKIQTVVFFFLILIAKENMPLWLVFIFIGFMLEKGFRNFRINVKQYLRFEIPLMLFASLYFYLVVFKLMPYLYGKESADMVSRIGYEGGSAGGLIRSMILHPWDSFKLFFESTSADVMSVGIKKEFHIVMLLSGGVAVLLRPAYLVMLIPLYVQKMLNGNSGYWGITGQYSIEFAPIIALALIDLMCVLKNKYVQYITLSVVAVSTCWIHYQKIESRKTMWYDRVVHDFTDKEHYSSGGLNTRFIHNELKKIPDEIPLSVSANLAPHLADRDRLYHFPNIDDAQMVVLLTDKRSTYPISKEDFEVNVKGLKESGDFVTILDSHDLLILKRAENLNKH